jgi:proline dehydrogenase
MDRDQHAHAPQEARVDRRPISSARALSIMGILTFLARRFVAGETAGSAVAVGLRLAREGIRATFDLLGEHVHDQTTARRSAEDVMALIRAIPPELERNVSIKLTQMGLEVSRGLCLDLVRDVLATSRSVDGFVRIDMEGSRHTQATLDVFRELRRDFENVGCVLQASLRRTENDVAEAVKRGDRVRLCKGAYKEPASIAWHRTEEIRESFKRSAERLLSGGVHPAIATHDETLIRHALRTADAAGLPCGRFELQMLYGLRPRRWRELVREGCRVRIYVPFGTHWLPYFYRRLREKKENVLFVIRHLLRG